MKLYLLILITLITGSVHARLHVEWEHIFQAHVNFTSDLKTDHYRLYLSGDYGIYVSGDHGETWDLTIQLPISHYFVGIAVGRRSVYAASHRHGVFRSEGRRALNWENKSEGLPRVDDPLRLDEYHNLRSIHVTHTNELVAVTSSDLAYLSTDRGETWRYTGDEWVAPYGVIDTVDSFYDRGGEWWLSGNDGHVVRSLDRGKTWISAGKFDRSGIYYWAELNGTLYAAGAYFGRYNPGTREWELFHEGIRCRPRHFCFSALAVHNGRLFAGTPNHGAYLFDERAETFVPIGFHNDSVSHLLSYRDHLYLVTDKHEVNGRLVGGLNGVYRASIPRVQSYDKAAVTWGAVKRK